MLIFLAFLTTFFCFGLSGHIACGSASNSEIVIPLRRHGEVIGVLDIDSPIPARFTEEDAKGLEEFAKILESSFYQMNSKTFN